MHDAVTDGIILNAIATLSLSCFPPFQHKKNRQGVTSLWFCLKEACTKIQNQAGVSSTPGVQRLTVMPREHGLQWVLWYGKSTTSWQSGCRLELKWAQLVATSFSVEWTSPLLSNLTILSSFLCHRVPHDWCFPLTPISAASLPWPLHHQLCSRAPLCYILTHCQWVTGWPPPCCPIKQSQTD